MPSAALALGVLALYFIAVVIVGQIAHRLQQASREDYFLASRSFGLFLLFLSVLGTNLSAFAMLGAPGQAYHIGIGIYWVAAAMLSITFPLLFFFLGYRIWLLGKKYGYSTPIEMFTDRFQSTSVGMFVFAIMLVYTVPYIVIGQIGSGLALQGASGGAIPYWVGSLLVTLIVGLYVSTGGMRGTAFTNAVQVLTFLAFLVVALFAVPAVLGGFGSLGQQLVTERPELLQRGTVPQTSPLASILQVFTFSAAFMAFPHVFLRMLAARDGAVIKKMSIIYPFGFFLAYVPVVALAIWGAVVIPGLEGSASDNIIIMMVGEFMSPLVAGFALAALYAMIMSTMDAQVLAVSNLFTVDIVERFWPSSDDQGERAIRLGRLFVAVVLAVGLLISLVRVESVFFIANLAFTGFGVLFPIIVGALYFRRMNKQGALAGMIVGSVLAPLAFLGVIPLGPLPSLPVVAIETVVILVVTALTPSQADASEKFIGFFDSVFKRRLSEAHAHAAEKTTTTGPSS